LNIPKHGLPAGSRSQRRVDRIGRPVRQCTACIQPRGISDEFHEQRMLAPHGVGHSAETAGHYATKLRRPFCEQVHLLFALGDFVAFGGTSILPERSIERDLKIGVRQVSTFRGCADCALGRWSPSS
jgi:hypothetical protein